ncbi:MAG: L-fucose:H+ symporter permease [Bacteroidetes bacterium]|nr:L-fucose:H+ symporter permease [Bacteroidota bacterium]
MTQNKRNYTIPFIVVTSLFFLWALAHNLNPILIPHLKRACALSDMGSALIDSAFFIAYFIMAIPAGMIMQRFGYKLGIITGLLLFSCGAFLFYPAASAISFPLFLVALFIIASGLTFLETAANPYITILGKAETATLRLNFAQSFNGLGATIAPLLGGLFILSGKQLSEADIVNMSELQRHTFYLEEAATVKIPYVIIGFVVLLVAIIVYKMHLPEIEEEQIEKQKSNGKSVLNHSHLTWGIIAQFFYVGAQVGVGSFFIRFLGSTAAIDEQSAAYYLSVALLMFMIGRFIGTVLMNYIAANKLLALYSVINMLLLLIAVLAEGKPSVFCLMFVEFFMSIMFPTIFSLSIINLGKQTKLASSYIIMAIAGGAVIPLIMGRISDISSIQWAYMVPLACFIPVLFFGLKGYQVKTSQQ